MQLDYKGRIFSFRKLKRKKKRRRIFLSIILLIILAFTILYLVSSDQSKIKYVENMLLEGKINSADQYFKKWNGGLFHKSSKIELSGLIDLYRGNLSEAEVKLKKIGEKSSGLKFISFLEDFSDNGRYRELLVYSRFLRKTIPIDPGILIYTASAFTAVSDVQSSKQILAVYKKNPDPGYREKLGKIESVNNAVTSRRLDYIFDSNNRKIAYFDFKKRETVPLIKGFNFSQFDSRFRRGIRFFSLTLDSVIQNFAYKLFGKRGGSFILTDLAEGRIIAAVSVGKSLNNINRVFTELFEPGSTIKCITQFALLDSEIKNIFPLICKGNRVIGGKIFYDWIKHGTIEDSEEALARSCNISFAESGISLGFDKFKNYLEKFLFNRRDLTDLFLSFKMGNYKTKINGKYELARLSVGLDLIKETTVHMAIISSLIALNGKTPIPFMIVNKKNLFGLGNYYHKTSFIEVMKNNNSYLKVRQSMNRVVEDPEGTGKRALTEWVRLAAKTGTAGVKSSGLDSIVTGFFPLENPEYSFGLRIEHGGRAEIAGAKFIKKFLEYFYKEYK